MTPGLALFCLALMAIVRLNGHHTVQELMNQSLNAHQLNYERDPYTPQRLDRYRQLLDKKSLSKAEELEFNSICGSLLTTVPAPILPLKQFRLDTVTLAGGILYQFYRLYKLFPDTMNLLFFK